MSASPRPFVTLKLATSLDGRIATRAGESRWITGEEARAATHDLRAGHDAILVGIGTALADDPELTARPAETPARQPLRIVLDTKARLPVESRLARTLDKAPLVVVGAEAAQAPALEALGVRILRVESDARGIAIAPALAALRALGVSRLFVEGGGQVAAAFVAAGVVDALEWFRAPILLGGDGRPALGPLGLDRLSDAPRLRRVALRALGPDLWESYRRESECSLD